MGSSAKDSTKVDETSARKSRGRGVSTVSS